MLERPEGEAARDAVQYVFDSPLTAFTTEIATYARMSSCPAGLCSKPLSI